MSVGQVSLNATEWVKTFNVFAVYYFFIFITYYSTITTSVVPFHYDLITTSVLNTPKFKLNYFKPLTKNHKEHDLAQKLKATVKLV